MIGDLVDGHEIEQDWMPIGEIDDDMKRAVIAGEDSKFCSHRGFDVDAIAEAMRENAQRRGIVRGGSTISQQTAQNAFLWQAGGWFRKGLAAWFTPLIETLWSKQDHGGLSQPRRDRHRPLSSSCRHRSLLQ